MATFFCITVRFLPPLSHARGSSGEPEWPPSPLRLFQAIAGAAAARWNEQMWLSYAAPALAWLASQPPPTVIVAAGVPSNGRCRPCVPQHVGHNVEKSSRVGNATASIAAQRLKSEVHSPHPDGEAVHYLYAVADGDPGFITQKQTLIDAVRSVTHLGWGVARASGNAAELTEKEATELAGERWEPTLDRAGTPLHVPHVGTLQPLTDKREAFLNRLSAVGSQPVPVLAACDTVGYRRDTAPAPRPFCAFELRTLDFERLQPFDPVRRAPTVAGMVRHALADLARLTRPFGWTDADINTFVYGHTPDGTQPARGEHAHQRFAFLPLPSLEQRRGRGTMATAIRRVLVVGPPGREDAVAWARALSGQVLTPLDEHTQPAALRLIDRPSASLHTDLNLGPYVGESTDWSTVTPVLRPGHDDGNVEKAERLLRTAFLQAGILAELVRTAELEWRATGFRAGVDLAWRYELPPLKLPAYHVRVRWRVPVCGPFAVGAGRYRGLGVFAIDNGSLRGPRSPITAVPGRG